MWDESIYTVPLNASLATTLMVFSAFTLTYKDAVWAKVARVAVAPFIVLASLKIGFWDSKQNKYFHPFTLCFMTSGACVMIMRTIHLSLTSLYDASPPHWVDHRSEKKLPLPTSLGGRLLYTMDQLSAVRGSSFIPDRHWDFAASHVAKYHSPYSSKWPFIWSAIVQAMGLYLALDVGDTLVKRYLIFNPTSPNPIFELPFAIQCLGGLQIAVYPICFLSFMHITSAILCTGTGFTSDLDLWPPLFNQPFLSPSLSYFWSRGWHQLLRRDFERLSTLIMILIKRSSIKNPDRPSTDKSDAHIPPSHQLGAVVVSFTASAFMHTFVLQSMFDGYENPEYLTTLTLFQRYPEFFFFAIQPVGIAIDRLIARIGDSEKVRVARRLWVWVFLLWTSRWIADGFAKSRFWHERTLLVSPVRGILFGDWTGEESSNVALAKISGLGHPN